MELRELQYIIAIAEEKSVSKAAQKLFMSQPSLSLALTKAEEAYGVKLFSRTSQGMILTKQGEIYVDAAKHIISINNTMLSEMKNADESCADTVTLGINPRLGSSFLPAIMPKLKEAYPRMELEIIEGSGNELAEMLENFSIEIALLNHPIRGKHIAYKMLAKDNLLICLSPSCKQRRFAYFKDGISTPFLNLSYISDMPFVLTNPGQSTREKANQIFLAKGITPNIAMLTQSIITAAHLCSTMDYVTFIPESYVHMISPLYPVSLFRIEEEYSPQWNISIAYNKELIQSSAVRHFITIAEECGRQVFDR